MGGFLLATLHLWLKGLEWWQLLLTHFHCVLFASLQYIEVGICGLRAGWRLFSVFFLLPFFLSLSDVGQIDKSWQRSVSAAGVYSPAWSLIESARCLSGCRYYLCYPSGLFCQPSSHPPLTLMLVLPSCHRAGGVMWLSGCFARN